MTRLWVRVIARHRIKAQATVECGPEDARDALAETCRELDIACPIWLNKHEREFSEFRRTAFLPEHFMEEIHFDRLEIEFLDEDRSRSSRDPRNEF